MLNKNYDQEYKIRNIDLEERDKLPLIVYEEYRSSVDQPEIKEYMGFYYFRFIYERKINESDCWQSGIYQHCYITEPLTIKKAEEVAKKHSGLKFPQVKIITK